MAAQFSFMKGHPLRIFLITMGRNEIYWNIVWRSRRSGQGVPPIDSSSLIIATTFGFSSVATLPRNYSGAGESAIMLWYKCSKDKAFLPASHYVTACNSRVDIATPEAFSRDRSHRGCVWPSACTEWN